MLTEEEQQATASEWLRTVPNGEAAGYSKSKKGFGPTQSSPHGALHVADFAPKQDDDELVKIDGEVLSEEEYNLIADVNNKDIDNAINDWRKNQKDGAHKNLLDAQ